MVNIGKNVYVETLKRGCCNYSFVVTRNGVVMIDTPVVPSAAIEWSREIAGHGPPRYLINTEYHADHFGGNWFFEAVGIAHEGTRQGIMDASVEQVRQMLASVDPESLPLPNGFTIRVPTITFTEKLTLHTGSHTFEVIHMPGHTPFETAVYVPEERLIFVSDNVVSKTMPFFGHSLPYQWLGSIDRLEKMEFDILVPGHGDVGTKACLPEMRASIQACMDAVKQAIDRGMTLQEAKDRVRLTDLYPQLSGDKRTITWLQRVNIAQLYRALTS